MFDNEEGQLLWFKLAMNVLFSSKSKNIARQYREKAQEMKRFERRSSVLTNDSSLRVPAISPNIMKKKSTRSVNRRQSEAGTPKSRDGHNDSKEGSRDDGDQSSYSPNKSHKSSFSKNRASSLALKGKDS